MGCFSSKPIGDEEQQTVEVLQKNSHATRGQVANRTNKGGGNRKERSKRAAAIEQSLAKVRNEDHRASKLLLLGAGESGKSTVLKQMRLIHGTGFTDNERQLYSRVIWSHAVHYMRKLVRFAPVLGITLDCDDMTSPLVKYKLAVLVTDEWDIFQQNTDAQSRAFLAKHAVPLSEVRDEAMTGDGGGAKPSFAGAPLNPNANSDEEGFSEVSPGLLPVSRIVEEIIEALFQQDKENNGSVERLLEPSRQEVAEAIYMLWTRDAGIRKVFDNSSRIQMEGNAGYYFDHIYNYAGDNYSATDEDILRGRIKTTGVHQMSFNIKGQTLRIFDVGGQRSERRKWIHCFDDAKAVIYVAAVSEYDEYLYEDRRVRRIDETFSLFQQVCTSRWFKDTPIILFLNKVDRLPAKLATSPFTKTFPEFTGNPLSVDDVCNFYYAKFKSLDRGTPNRPIYRHNTCATDTNSMRFVTAAVSDAILQESLTWSGLL